MTAVRNQATLATLARTTELVDFIHQHGDKLGELSVLSASDILDNKVQINGHRRDSRITASALITWFYLLDNPTITCQPTSNNGAHIDIEGRHQGIGYSAYARVNDEYAAYLLSLDEVTVHALRRVQVGDVPAVDGELVPA